MTARSRVLLGIIGAAAAGALIGLLIAPEKGNVTRSRVRDTTGKWVDSMGRLFTRTSNQLDGEVKSKKRKVKSALS